MVATTQGAKCPKAVVVYGRAKCSRHGKRRVDEFLFIFVAHSGPFHRQARQSVDGKDDGEDRGNAESKVCPNPEEDPAGAFDLAADKARESDPQQPR